MHKNIDNIKINILTNKQNKDIIIIIIITHYFYKQKQKKDGSSAVVNRSINIEMFHFPALYLQLSTFVYFQKVGNCWLNLVLPDDVDVDITISRLLNTFCKAIA